MRLKPRDRRDQEVRDLHRGLMRHLPIIDVESSTSRPKKRSECIDSARPCPWVTCRHHMLIWLVTIETKEIRPLPSLNLKGSKSSSDDDMLVEALAIMPNSCSLDLADSDERNREEVGAILGFTREHVRIIEERAFAKIRKNW